MSKDYIKIVSTASSASLEKMDKIGIVTGDGVRMRSGAGTSYSTIGYYNKGIQVKVTGKTGSWYAVSYNGLSGYMSADYVKLSTGNAVARQDRRHRKAVSRNALCLRRLLAARL